LTLTPEQLAQSNPAYWADYNNIQLQTTKFSFKEHEYQWEPMQLDARRICYSKATQGGYSELEVLKTLHGLIYKKFPEGVLYMFPTTDDVGEFSKSRFNPLIFANRDTIGKYVKTGGKGTDTTSLKKIHDAFLYLRGARLSQSLGGMSEKESAKLRGIPVDRVVFDEVDLMDDAVIAKAKGRMGHSKIKEEVYISNPTLPDFGIDAIYAKSDQRHLFNRCSCGEWTCAVLEFPECVKIRPDGTGYIACKKCGKEITRRSVGEWVPAIRENTEYMKGYQWPQLNSMFNDPAEILSDFLDPPQGNLGDVYRLRLGLPYVATEDRLSVGAVYEQCSRDMMPTHHNGPCAMGVDVGKIKHVVIGVRTGKDRYEIVKVAKLSNWSDIHDLAKKFNVRSAVIDIRPYEDAARGFQRSENYKIFLCEYTESSTIGTSFNDKSGVVKVNRTEILDSTHRLITENQILLPRRSPEMDEFAKQLCGTAKVLETNKKTGTSVYRYRPVGSAGDHYRHSLNYFYLAASNGKIANVKSSRNRQKVARNDFVENLT